MLHESRKKVVSYLQGKKELNKRERLLGLDESELIRLSEWDRWLGPFEDLWELVERFSGLSHSWTRDNIFKQDFEFIETECKKMYKSAMQLANNPVIRRLAPETPRVADSLSEEVKKFQRNIPLISVFSNPGLKERHFQEISKIIGFESDNLSSLNLSLNKVIGLGANDYISQL